MKKVLIIRHGIVINALFTARLEHHFRRLGYHVENQSYPTTRKRIEEHAKDLADFVNQLAESSKGEPTEFYFLTHSLGGLVFRYAMTHCTMPKIKRAVLTVPPNQGSTTARFFKNFLPYRWVFGRHAGAQLASDPPGIFEQCGVPRDVEIGIIAGDVQLKLYPTVPLKPPHDGVVSAHEAILGDFPMILLPFHHTPILFRQQTALEAAHFLETGSFLSEPVDPARFKVSRPGGGANDAQETT